MLKHEFAEKMEKFSKKKIKLINAGNKFFSCIYA